MTDGAVWLSCYLYIFAISTNLTTVNQRLTNVFTKNYVLLERSSLDEAKKASNHRKTDIAILSNLCVVPLPTVKIIYLLASMCLNKRIPGSKIKRLLLISPLNNEDDERESNPRQ